MLRWFLDGTRLAQLAADNRISASTGYRYLHEGIDALAAQAPGLRGALLAARRRAHPRARRWHADPHRSLLGARPDRPPRPPRYPGGSVVVGQAPRPWRQHPVITAPDGWPIWTSPVRPGREHDTTALRAHPEVLPALAE